MVDAILTTKLYVPPVRSQMVSRPRLIDCLTEGLKRKLTVISAPAGRWAARTGGPLLRPAGGPGSGLAAALIDPGAPS